MPKSAQDSGFSLVELLITITIITLLGLFTVANFGSFGEGQKVKGAAFDIQSLIKSTQANASSRVACPLDTNNYGASWWMEIQTGSSSLTQKCQIGAGAISTIKTYNITSSSPSLAITSIKCANNSTITAGLVTVKYAPLTATASFSDSSSVACIATSQFLYITVINNKTQETKVVKIDKGGTASVQ